MPLRCAHCARRLCPAAAPRAATGCAAHRPKPRSAFRCCSRPPCLRDDEEIVQAMCTRLRTADWRARVADAAWAAANAHAQMLLTATALAAWNQLARSLPMPTCITGYSVGEL